MLFMVGQQWKKTSNTNTQHVWKRPTGNLENEKNHFHKLDYITYVSITYISDTLYW